MKTARKIFESPNLTRRAFLRSASLAAAGGVLHPSLSRAATGTRLKAAVIGHTGRGDYGHGLEGIFSNHPGIEVVALADPDTEAREKMAAKIGAPRHYADYRELLEKERPGLVSLAMRQSDQHHAIALVALRAGAHLYCEKPFTVSPEEADELLAEAGSRNLKIAVAHTMRMMPVVVRFRQAVAEGVIGELTEMRAYGKQDTRAGGEDMMVLGSHLFDLMRMFAGDPLWCSARVLWQGREITREDRRLVKDNVGFVAGDQVFAQFAFSNGVNATFTSAAKLRETSGHWGIELHGSAGVARINGDLTPNIFIRRASQWREEGKFDQWQPFHPAFARLPAPHNSGPVDDWLAAIEQNREPECSGRNGAWAVEMAMAVYHSTLTGARASFPLADRKHPLRA